VPGYPDYQRAPTQQSEPVINEFLAAFAVGTTTYGPFSVSSYQGLYLQVEPDTQPLAVELDWSLTASSPVLLTESWYVLGGTQLAVIMPIPLRSVSVRITNLATVSDTGILYAGPVNVPAVVDNYRALDRSAPLCQWSGSIAAGGTQTVTALSLFAGPAVLSFHTNAPGKCTVYVDYLLNAVGSWQILEHVETATGQPGMTITVMLPRATVRMQVNNGSSTAQTIQATLTVGR